MPDNNLPELRDIHLPDEIAMFPHAYGWGVILLAAAGLFFVFWLLRKLHRRSKKKYALSVLAACPEEPVAGAAEISRLLRRICLLKHKEASALFGQEWVDFLNSRCRTKLSGKAAKLLADAPYIGKNSQIYGSEELNILKNFCRKWIGENL